MHVSPLYPVAHLQTNPSDVDRHLPPLWHGFGWHGSLSVLKGKKTVTKEGKSYIARWPTVTKLCCSKRFLLLTDSLKMFFNWLQMESVICVPSTNRCKMSLCGWQDRNKQSLLPPPYRSHHVDKDWTNSCQQLQKKIRKFISLRLHHVVWENIISSCKMQT